MAVGSLEPPIGPSVNGNGQRAGNIGIVISLYDIVVFWKSRLRIRSVGGGRPLIRTSLQVQESYPFTGVVFSHTPTR